MQDTRPDVVMVPGDVNSTLAGALAANRMGLPLCHLEAGLRSFDRAMPEEVNRILVDQLTDTYFVTEQSGLDHLKEEGLDVKSGANTAHLVGNTMIDTIVAFDEEIQANPILKELGLDRGRYILMTMHRPSNVDNAEGLNFILEVIRDVARDQKVVFPLHPRTRKKCEEFGIWSEMKALSNIVLVEPMDYFTFQHLIAHASTVITDSGGISRGDDLPAGELRDLAGKHGAPLHHVTSEPTRSSPETSTPSAPVWERPKSGVIPPLWDGRASQRILDILA